MPPDNQSNNNPQPQTADDGSAVFTDGGDFFRHMRFVSVAASFRWLKYSVIFFCPALLYAIFFVIAEKWYPQFYRSWLDFCLPLAEYVGGLTPRAERITEKLITGGYAHRADDALHGVAIARVMLTPAIVCLIAAVIPALKNTPPAVVKCTRRGRKEMWYAIIACCCFIAMIPFHEFVFGEDFYATRYASSNYYWGNYAMIHEVSGTYLMLGATAVGILIFLTLRVTQFNIVEQPENK